jgi:pimeloyl-ACP methyl ester carboxylesterase
LWVVPGAGHRVPWDAPEAFAAKVGEFLERVRS